MAESDFFFDFSPYYHHFSEKNGDNKCNMNWCHEVTLQQRLVRTYSQIYCLIFLLILKSHPHILEVDNKFPVRH